MTHEASVYVHLVRHGEVENPHRLSYGRLPGFPLSDDGRRQAAVTGAYLRSFGGRIEAIATSPLERAKETAEILREATGGPEVGIDARLIEASSWRDGLPRALSPLAYARRYFNPKERVKSEAPVAIAERMHDAVVDVLAALREDGAAAVLVSHQTPISFARVALEKGLETFHWSRLGNVTPWAHVTGVCDLASVTTFVFERGSRGHVRYFCP